jgi:hypothetical protein
MVWRFWFDGNVNLAVPRITEIVVETGKQGLTFPVYKKSDGHFLFN